MTLSATSLAAAVGASVQNVQFKAGANNLPRKILIIGTYRPANTSVVAGVPVLITSPEDAGYQFGFGSMIHRLAIKAFLGSQGVETWVLPQAEIQGAAAAAGAVTFSASSVAAGTVYIYIAGELVGSLATTASETASDIATAFAAAVTAQTALPVSAAVDGSNPAKVNLTAKSKGPWGNKITISTNLNYGDSTPTGLTITVTSMSAGAGVPTMADALADLGTGDYANEKFFTDVVHGYLQDTTTMDAVANYVGQGNTATGLYDKLIGRPFRCLMGDTVSGSGGLSALIALGNGRTYDRANGVIAVPGSMSHPAEIAAQALGIMAMVNNDRVAQHYLGMILSGVHVGATADRWTSSFDSRNTAVNAGISPTRVVNNMVTMQNVVTFYHPSNIPSTSNGYRSMRNISILQNILYNIRANFEQESWQGVSIVADKNAVGSITDKVKVRDISDVKSDLIALANAFASQAWLYTASYSVANISVSIRPGTTGFNTILPVILSGECDILDNLVQFDTSIAVLQ